MHFLTSLPLLWVQRYIAEAPKAVLMDDLCARYFYVLSYVDVSYILVCDIESLETWVVATMLLGILESKGPHKISGG